LNALPHLFRLHFCPTNKLCQRQPAWRAVLSLCRRLSASHLFFTAHSVRRPRGSSICLHQVCTRSPRVDIRQYSWRPDGCNMPSACGCIAPALLLVFAVCTSRFDAVVFRNCWECVAAGNTASLLLAKSGLPQRTCAFCHFGRCLPFASLPRFSTTYRPRLPFPYAAAPPCKRLRTFALPPPSLHYSAWRTIASALSLPLGCFQTDAGLLDADACAAKGRRMCWQRGISAGGTWTP